MIANAMLIALALLLACLFWLMGELKFLVPYKRLIFHQYGTMLLAWSASSSEPLRRDLLDSAQVFLKDTGRKLRHIDNQASGSHTSMPLPDGDWNAR